MSTSLSPEIQFHEAFRHGRQHDGDPAVQQESPVAGPRRQGLADPRQKSTMI